ncbi:hypothetical protein AB2L57_10645 [Microbacterium sp. HA-8]|uniref:hypothetical protein n=1 Tax=Microbacterium sp. HA-8 TaxID=3234200 RepID=UPI0038F71F80
MYTLNGLPAHSPSLGWILTYDTTFIYSTTITRPEVRIPGFDGAVEMDGVEDVPGVTLVWSVRESELPGLRNVLRSPTLTLGKGAGEAEVNLRSFTPEKIGIGSDPEYTVTAELVIPGVWTRGAEVTATTPLDQDTQVIDVLTGSDGKVSDGTLLIDGPFAPGVEVHDMAGLSWIRYTKGLWAGATLRYDMATGRAWVHNASNPYESPLYEATADIETGPEIYYLRITPVIDGADPTLAQPKLRVTSTGRSATSALTVRARPAYIL